MFKYIYLVIFFVSCSSSKVITEKDLIYFSTFENLNNFGSFIWTKKREKITFNTKNLKIIAKEKGKYYKSLVKYTSYLTSSTYKIKDINFSERCYIILHLTNLGEKIELDNKHSFIVNLIYADRELIYYKEFERRKFYNLSDLKKEYYQKLKELNLPKKETIPIKPSGIK